MASKFMHTDAPIVDILISHTGVSGISTSNNMHKAQYIATQVVGGQGEWRQCFTKHLSRVRTAKTPCKC